MPRAPILGVGAILFREDRVLLVRRGHAPRKGSWSLPGGRVEPGERLSDALRREVLEETGVEVEVISLLDLFEYVERDEGGSIVHHYVVADYLCRDRGGEPRAGSDVEEAVLAPLDEIENYRLNPEALQMIEKALPLRPV